jgi:hypothetical protein
MSCSRLPVAIMRWVVGAGIALWIAGDALSAVVYTRVRIQNSRQSLTFLRGKKRESDPVGGMGMQSVLDSATGVRINTIFSPTFQIELRSLDPATYPAVRIPDGVLNFVLLPLEQCELVADPDTPNGARLTWSDIPIPNSPQLLAVVVRVSLRAADGKAVWTIAASVDQPGPYGIHSVRFPYFGLREIDPDATDNDAGGVDDNFLIPMTGGQVVPNPMATGNNHPERVPDEGDVRDAYFTYPGNIMSQYMAYYDPTIGLYMAADDVTGKTKNLYFNKGNPVLSPSKTRVYCYFTHFNTAPAPAAGQTSEQVARAFGSFSLRSKLGYTVVTDVFSGDWLDATKIYREWVLASGAPWIGLGPIVNRTDIATPIVQTAYALRWQLPPSPDAVEPLLEIAKVQRTLAFYEQIRDLYDPNRLRDFVPLALLSQAQIGPNGIIGVGRGDDVAEPLRPGVPEFLFYMHNPPAPGLPIRAIALNRDTTGIDVASPNVPEALQRGVMRNADLSPVVTSSGNYRTCLGASWTRQRRTSIILQTVQESFFNGFPGFTMAAVTGTGNFCFTCYAPMEDDPSIVNRAYHNHVVGGGSYLTAGWYQLAQDLKAGAQNLGLPFFLLGMEHSPETMVKDYILVGRSFSDPYDDTQDGVGRTINGAFPVPLFKFLYHDFNPWPGNPPYMTNVVDLYVDDAHPLADILLVRFRIGQLAMHGRLLKYRLSQNADQATYDGPPDLLPPEVQDEHRYFASIATLRAFAPQYLVAGRALRDPEVTPLSANDSVSIRFLRLGVETIRNEPRILTSAWHDPGGDDVGIVFTNYTPRTGQCRFTFQPREYDLSPGTEYKVQKAVGINLWVDVTGWTFNGSDASVTFGPVVVPGMEELNGPPWSVYRIVPAGVSAP